MTLKMVKKHGLCQKLLSLKNIQKLQRGIMSRYDDHLKTFCLYEMTEVSPSKLAVSLEIDYGSLRNWWTGKRIGRKKVPELSDDNFDKLEKWALLRGYDPNRQYDPIIK
jgi:hypothetical protein